MGLPAIPEIVSTEIKSTTLRAIRYSHAITETQNSIETGDRTAKLTTSAAGAEIPRYACMCLLNFFCANN